jgi:4-hydroxythreonine-4-phosphate dehydrogenase
VTRVAITIGDPRGIGPELVQKIVMDPPPGADLVVVGPAALVATLPCSTVTTEADFDGVTEASAGTVAAQAIERAVRLAQDGEVAAIMTAPISKAAINSAGYHYPGHTEMLAHLAGDVDVAMMLVSDVLRVVLITKHIPLAEVPKALTREAIERVAVVTRNALADQFGLPEPRLALCALNPHAGESGLIGTEETETLGPVAKDLGLSGPHPADTVFVRAIKGEFDAVLAPYHDVGMTAIKVASFGKAVNVTLGLPFIRTSPDHGTAFDIAGKGVADPSSMREAVGLAVELGRGF